MNTDRSMSFEARVKELFAAAVSKGSDASDAAVTVFRQAQQEQQQATAAEAQQERAAISAAPVDASSAQAMLAARVHVLFGELTASGICPNEAAAKALELASTELRQQPPVTPAASAATPVPQEGGTEGGADAPRDPLALVPQLSSQMAEHPNRRV